MERILDQLNPGEHCPECGAFLAGQLICAHCGHEEQPEMDTAAIIPLVAKIGRHVPLTTPSRLRRRIA